MYLVHWMMVICIVYMDENVIFLLQSVMEMVRHSKILGMKVVRSFLISNDKLSRI